MSIKEKRRDHYDFFKLIMVSFVPSIAFGASYLYIKNYKLFTHYWEHIDGFTLDISITATCALYVFSSLAFYRHKIKIDSAKELLEIYEASKKQDALDLKAYAEELKRMRNRDNISRYA